MSKILKALITSLRSIRRRDFPRRVTLKELVPEGCTFEITNPVEAYRVEEYGGETEFTQSILEDLRPNDVLFDLGACVGLVTIHAAAKGARVVAFEPDPGFRSRLLTNIRLNGLENVQVVEWAVSDSTGDAALFTDGIGGNSPSLRETGNRGVVRVRADTLDNALARAELPPPDVIKMDIEGAEILALRGMASLLKSRDAPRSIFIEIHPEFLPSFDSSVDEVIETLQGVGYRQDWTATRENQIHCIFRKHDEP